MNNSDRIIRMKTVLARTGLSRSTLYRKIADGTFRASFPSASMARDGGSPPSIAGSLIRQLTGRRGPSDVRYRRALAVSGEGTVKLSGGLLLRLPELAGNDLLPIAQEIEMIGPVLHHAHPLIPIFAPRIGTAHGIVVAMGKLALDRVRMP